jgi:hypothetical protein
MVLAVVVLLATILLVYYAIVHAMKNLRQSRGIGVSTGIKC